MASDQRYCLECGARRVNLGSRGGAPGRPPGSASAQQRQPEVASSAGSGASIQVRPNGTPAVIAGVGVLLLAMGVGVLIGRAGAGSGRPASGPAQVISVAAPGAGAGGAATSPSSTAPSSTPGPSATHKSGKSSSSGVGSSPGKPAPPAVVKNLRTGGGGQSYEQKSKNLPDVVSTG